MKRFIVLAVLLPVWLFSQKDYSVTPTGLPYTTPTAARNAIPKTEQKPGKIFYVKLGGDIHRYTWSTAGTPVPYFEADTQRTVDLNNVVYRNPISGKDISIVDRIVGNISYVEEFRKPGDLDADVIERAIKATLDKGSLGFGGRNYNLHRQIIVPPGIFHWFGGNLFCMTDEQFKSAKPNATQKEIEQFQAIKKIVNPAKSTANDSAIPTDTDSGPLKGCFYFPGLSYYCTMSNMSFSGFRFPISFQYTYNGMSISDCSFWNSNVAVMNYTCCQGLTMTNTTGGGIGSYVVALATATADGNIWRGGDHFFFDGFSWLNPRHLPVSTELQPNFDDWYYNTIFRPWLKFTGAGPWTYDWNYPKDHRYSNPSGWVIYVPSPINRPMQTPTFENIYVVNGCQRGFALLLASIQAPTIKDNFSGENCKPEVAMFEVTKVIDGKCESANPVNSNLFNFSENFGTTNWLGLNMMGGAVTGNFWLDREAIWNNQQNITIAGGISQSYNDVIRFQIRDKVKYKMQDIVDLFSTAKLYIGRNVDQEFNEVLPLSLAKAAYIQDGQTFIDFYFKENLPKSYYNAAAVLVLPGGISIK